MSHPSKAKGTRWESAVRDFLNSHGLETFRPALHGNLDKGDLFGVADWTVQCRDTARIDLAGAIDDARKQSLNAGTAAFVAIVKRRRRGVAEAYAVMPLELWSSVVVKATNPPGDAASGDTATRIR